MVVPLVRERVVGDRVRELRTETGISLRKLADQTNFSASFISQVENGQASPSINSLERIAGALGVTLGEFFTALRPGATTDLIVRAIDRPQLTSAWSNAQIDALGSMGHDRRMEPVLMTLEPGGRSGKHPHPHVMEEFAFVLEGEVQLTLGEDVHLLRAGDSATIPPQRPRCWENAGGTAARVLIVSARNAR